MEYFVFPASKWLRKNCSREMDLTIKCDSRLRPTRWAISPTFLLVCRHGASRTAPLYKVLLAAVLSQNDKERTTFCYATAREEGAFHPEPKDSHQILLRQLNTSLTADTF
ncbi:hypothetical protein F2P81_001747 [Scophthalmus maximus]|uniref:Uncharacterized protein n=1 Tax=Scophthalmus maximus TaxID=52904 RepID=A0A6A4TL58_SCOMX|nr:hypothetical protein F2P81_001747 [Scophthalmus maximus]